MTFWIHTRNTNSESIEGDNPDDYHKIDEKTMHNIRCTDDIYKFNHMDSNKNHFLMMREFNMVLS